MGGLRSGVKKDGKGLGEGVGREKQRTKGGEENERW